MQTFDTIRARLLQNAGNRLPEISPENRLLLDWMAWELSSVYRELSRSNDTIEQHLQRRLTPDTATRAVPAHALMQARPKKPGLILNPDEHTFMAQRLAHQPPYQIFFSPLVSTLLVKGEVKFIAHGQSLEEAGDPFQRQPRLTSLQGKTLHPGILWLGLQVEEEFSPEREYCFHISWPQEPGVNKKEKYTLLPLVEWRQGATSLSADTGITQAGANDRRHISRHFDGEFMHLYMLEKQIMEQYNFQFVRLQGLRTDSKPPAELAEYFEPGRWEEVIPKGIIWLQLQFPNGFTAEDIRKINIRLNCFPVANRKIDTSQDFMPSHEAETRSLSNTGNGRAALADEGAYFLGIQRIFTRKDEYRPVAHESFPSASPGCYALQHGRVEANDLRDLQGRARELIYLLRSRTSTLRLGAQHEMENALRSLENGAQQLEDAAQSASLPACDLGYYLHLKVLDVQDMILVRFWVTQGNFANGAARRGDWLRAEEGKSLVNEGGVLLTEVGGGGEPEY